MRHFGILKGMIFDASKQKEACELLVEKGLFELTQTATGNSSNVKDGVLELIIKTDTIIVQPVQELLDEFYSYLTNNIFKHYILEQRIIFFSQFNDRIYGLEFLEKKKNALDNFNKIYEEIYEETIIPIEQTISENGIVHNYNFGKLQMLYYQLNSVKSSLADKIKLNNYLNGNSEFFTKENLLENYEIKEELQFEIWVQILVELNDRFQFEEDTHFTKIGTDKLKYERYGAIFKSLLSYQFTDRKIRSFNKDHKAHIESLYEVLLKEELIVNHKGKFIDFIKNEYGIIVSKIIDYTEKTNYLHNDRVQLFLEEWRNLMLKKE